MKKIDKRSKEWKSMTQQEQEAHTMLLKQENKSKGLGDTIEKITEATGIKTVVKSIFGDDCGCDERKVKLNKLFPYKTECLIEDEYLYLDDLFKRLKNTLLPADQVEVLFIYNRVFNMNMQPTSCSSCWVTVIANLKKLYKEYDNEMR